MHYFDEIPMEPQLYIVEGDHPLLTEFTSYVLVKRAPSLVLDGGNSFDPFAISSFCRKLEVDAMEQVFVSRAFTVFQLKVLITELPSLIEDIHPSVVFVSFFSDLFFSDDVEEEISIILQRKLLFRLKAAVKKHCIPIIVTDHQNNSDLFDCRVFFKAKRDMLLVSVNQRRIEVPLLPHNQKTLDVWRDRHG